MCNRYVQHVKLDPVIDELVVSMLRDDVLQRRINICKQRKRNYSHEELQTKQHFMELWESKGWKVAHQHYPNIHHSTAFYWRTHPYVLQSENRAPVSGRPSTFSDDEEENIRAKLLRLSAPGVMDLIQIALNKAGELAAADPSREDLLQFTAGNHWVSNFCGRRQLPLREPHPVSKSKFERAQKATKKQILSDQYQ